MQKYVLLALLCLCAWEDFKKKEVRVIPILMFGIVGMLLHLYAPTCSIRSVLLGCFLGAAIMAFSCLSRGSIGMGDGILLAVTGVYLGGEGNLELFLTGLAFAAAWSLAMLALKKKKGKDEIAFVPFLLISYVTMLAR